MTGWLLISFHSSFLSCYFAWNLAIIVQIKYILPGIWQSSCKYTVFLEICSHIQNYQIPGWFWNSMSITKFQVESKLPNPRLICQIPGWFCLEFGNHRANTLYFWKFAVTFKITKYQVDFEIACQLPNSK
jgi:hypothetical protein